MEYFLKKASTTNDFKNIAALADKVWHHTYDDLIGSAQAEYMINKFQSAEVLEKDVKENGYEYLMALQGNILVGYCGVHPENSESVFLSKVYVDPMYQHQGIAKKMIGYYAAQYAKEGVKKIWLTVNKGNQNAISAYEKLGFHKSGELVTEIGGGYVMDDDLMELHPADFGNH